MATGCRNQVALSQAGLPDDMRWNPGIPRVGEIAVPGATNEAAVARGIEPSHRFTIGDDWCRRCLWLIVAATSAASAITAMASTIAVALKVFASLVSMEVA